jgi:fimbrial chaperone protein
MKLFRGLVRTLITALAAVAAVFASPAWSMTVQPVVIDLSVSGRGMSQVITVENTFSTPLPVELRVQELAFDETGVKATGKESEDLLIFPPQALIQPGQTQTFRIQYVGDPDLKASKHYYVTVAQLPVKLPEGQSAIQILYNFQVLVSVSPAGAKPALAIQSAEIGKNAQGKPVPVITLANTSAAHGYLSSGRLRIVQTDASGKEVFRKTLTGPEVQQTIGFGLVGANQVRKMTLPIELPVDGGKIDASFTPES